MGYLHNDHIGKGRIKTDGKASVGSNIPSVLAHEGCNEAANLDSSYASKQSARAVSG
jgi:hypothetical protein